MDEIRFGNLTRLIFRGPYDTLSELMIEGTIIMRRGTDERVLDAWQEGRYTPSVLSPLLELLGTTVTHSDIPGTLLTFSNAWELSVQSYSDREQGWQFVSGKNASKHIARDAA